MSRVLTLLLLIAAAAIALIACGDGASPAPSPTTTPPASPTATPAPPSPTPTPEPSVTIAAVGDVLLGRNLRDWMEQHGTFYPFERVAHLLQNADLTLANLEVAVTERGQPANKAYTFRTPPRLAGGLVEAGIDFVSLGNNHTADYGREGVEDTIATMDALGIAWAGAGLNEAQARRPAFLEANGIRFAVLSYTDVSENTFATSSSFGVARATTDVIAPDVQAARQQADAVIVTLHFGIEYTTVPQPSQVELAHAAIDAGALLVLGHHTHTLQGWERYGDGLIAYSLGNFVFDLGHDPRNIEHRSYETVVLYVTVAKDRVLDVRAEPVVIDLQEDRPRPPTPEEAAAIEARLQELIAIAGG